ncbi:hypothetical protein [Secundilactobacillus silagei]|uniref:hypothetical protein n=1 Tax=Secundilactobacillus silagei TaxID=1293415 RepID=UPI00209250FD|nr:hypothetical protein [Secundilactobacillus silagei]
MTFKKILVGIGSLALALTLAACGQSKSSSTQQMADKQDLNLSTTDTISTLDNSAASESVSLTAYIPLMKGYTGWGSIRKWKTPWQLKPTFQMTA